MWCRGSADFFQTKKKAIRPLFFVASREEGKLERVKGIEPSLSAWEAGVMPLYDTRVQRLTLYQMSCTI